MNKLFIESYPRRASARPSVQHLSSLAMAFALVVTAVAQQCNSAIAQTPLTPGGAPPYEWTPPRPSWYPPMPPPLAMLPQCNNPEMRSKGIFWLNYIGIGKRAGPNVQAVEFEGPITADYPITPQSNPYMVRCHVTIVFDNGYREKGTMDFSSTREGLHAAWTSDITAAANAAAAKQKERELMAGICEASRKQYQDCSAMAAAAKADILSQASNEYQRRALERTWSVGHCEDMKYSMWKMGCP